MKEEEEYPNVGRDYECDMCLENKILYRLCEDCFPKVLHNHLVAFSKSGLTHEEYIHKNFGNKK